MPIRAPPTSDFSGTINWGDGNTTTFTSGAVPASGGTFTVSGSHQYAEEGLHDVTVTINDKGGSTTTDTGTTTVADAPLTAGTVTVSGGVEGDDGGDAERDVHRRQSGRHRRAISRARSIGATAPRRHSPARGHAARRQRHSFTVSGSHTYAEEGSYNVTVVTINDDGGSSATDTGTTTVADAPLTAGTVTVAAASRAYGGDAERDVHRRQYGRPGQRLLGHDQLGRRHGRRHSPAPPSRGSGGSYTVSGSHQYAEDGTTRPA